MKLQASTYLYGPKQIEAQRSQTAMMESLKENRDFDAPNQNGRSRLRSDIYKNK